MTKHLILWTIISISILACESRVYNIPSPNMEATLPVGSTIVVGFEEVQRNDIFVFKFPLDKSVPYVKRLIAIPGDTLLIVDGEVIINRKKQVYPATIQHAHLLKTDESLRDRFFEERNISERNRTTLGYVVMISDRQAQELRQVSFIQSVEKQLLERDEQEFYARYEDFEGWNRDQFGPLYMPKAGDVIKGDELSRYVDVVQLHEGEDISRRNSYTFKKSYCFAMGDNRHNSLDSRYWGLIPMDDVIGKAQSLNL